MFAEGTTSVATETDDFGMNTTLLMTVGYDVCNRTQEEAAAEESRKLGRLMLPVTVFMAILMVAGIVGNGIVCFTYAMKKKKPTFQIYVLCLAFVDLFSCFFTHPYLISKLFRFYNPPVVICKIFEFLIRSCLEVQIFLLVCLAFDRYHAIRNPLNYNNRKRVYHSIVVSVGLSVSCSAYVLPYYGWKNIPGEDACSSRLHFCHYRDGFEGSLHFFVAAGFELAGTFVSTTVILVVYSMVAREMVSRTRQTVPVTEDEDGAGSGDTSDQPDQKLTVFHTKSTITTKWQMVHPKVDESSETASGSRTTADEKTGVTSMNSKPSVSGLLPVPQAHGGPRMSSKRKTQRRGRISKSHIKITKTLVVVTGMLFLTWLPFWVIRIGEILDPESWKPKNDLMELLFSFLNHLIYINNGINPLIYTLQSISFREDSVKAWRKIRRLTA